MSAQEAARGVERLRRFRKLELQEGVRHLVVAVELALAAQRLQGVAHRHRLAEQRIDGADDEAAGREVAQIGKQRADARIVGRAPLLMYASIISFISDFGRTGSSSGA